MSFAHVGRLFSLSQQATLKHCMQPCTVAVPDLLSLQPPTSAPTPSLEPPELSMGSAPSLCPGCWLQHGGALRFGGFSAILSYLGALLAFPTWGKPQGMKTHSPAQSRGCVWVGSCRGVRPAPTPTCWGAQGKPFRAASAHRCVSVRSGVPSAGTRPTEVPPEPLCGELRTSLRPKTGLNEECRQPTFPPRLSMGAALAHSRVRGSLVWGGAVTILHPSALNLQ